MRSGLGKGRRGILEWEGTSRSCLMKIRPAPPMHSQYLSNDDFHQSHPNPAPQGIAKHAPREELSPLPKAKVLDCVWLSVGRRLFLV